MINVEPKVTIVIPAYNASNYIREAIDSALNQTYKNIEIIVINDGSNDNGATERIAKSYGSKIIYMNKENGGVSTALNFAISKMSGDYFSWLSHDDKYYPDKVQKQIDYLKDNDLIGKKVILYSDYDLMDNHSRIFATSVKNHDELMKKPEYCLLRGAINGLSLLVPREAFSECGNFDETLRCVQDYELWERMQRKYRFIHQPEVLVTTRLHELQQGNTNPKMLTEGNPFWINLIRNTSKEKKEQLEGTEYNFHLEMKKFLETTPYNLALEYVQDEIKRIEEESIKKIEDIKVSIIIPFYNRIPKVLRAMDSVLSQTHKNIEILLINDGTTDSTEEIDKAIQQNLDKIKYIKNNENRGVSYSRNIGIREAKGEYIVFLDSDDEFIKDKIEIQLKDTYLKGYMVSHTSYIRREDGREQILDTGKLNGKAFPKIIGGCPIATPTVMIKTEYLRENNIYYNEKMTIGEDVCFYIEMLRRTDLLGIDKVLTIVNTDSNSSAYNEQKQLIGFKTIIGYVLNDQELFKYDDQIAFLFKGYSKIYDSINERPIDTEKVQTEKNNELISGKNAMKENIFRRVVSAYREYGIIGATKKVIKKVLRKLKIIK